MNLVTSAEFEKGADERPKAISRAVTLLWLALGIGVVRGVIRYIRHADVRSPGLGELVTLALWALSVFLIVQVWKGRHWARVAWIVIFCLAVPLGILPLFQSVTYFPVANGLGIAQTLIWLAGIVLMFQRDASTWFRPQRSGSSGVSSTSSESPTASR
jgi:hypothetical protein